MHGVVTCGGWLEGGGMVEGGVTIKPPGNNHRSPAPKTRIEQLRNLYSTVRVYIHFTVHINTVPT